MAQGYNIYWDAGTGVVDYVTSVGHAAPGAGQVEVSGLSLQPGVVYRFAIRAESAAGVEEQNTHVWTFVRIDANGDLLPPPLPPPRDVTACVTGDAKVALGFSRRACPPYAEPTAFEVFSDGGAGQMDMDDPVATVSGFGPEQEDFELLLTPQALPARFAVRPRKGEQIGPLSRIAVAAIAPAPAAPRTM